jgi:hypothetical protein
MNDKREALIRTGMIESGAYMYPNKSIRMPGPDNELLASPYLAPFPRNGIGQLISKGVNTYGRA